MAAISTAMTAVARSPFGLLLLLEQITFPQIKSSTLKFAFNDFQMCSSDAEFFYHCYLIRCAGKGVRTCENFQWYLRTLFLTRHLHRLTLCNRGWALHSALNFPTCFLPALPSLAFLMASSLLLNAQGRKRRENPCELILLPTAPGRVR